MGLGYSGWQKEGFANTGQQKQAREKEDDAIERPCVWWMGVEAWESTEFVKGLAGVG